MLGTRRFAALLALGAAFAVPIAGCGGSSNNNSTTQASNASTTGTTGGAAASGPGGAVSLTASEYKFSPSDPTVRSGNVTFTEKNAGTVTHSLEIENVNGQDKELEGKRTRMVAKLLDYSLRGRISARITCPTLVCAAEDDFAFLGHPERLYEDLTCPRTFIKFTAEEGAGAHCEAGAATLASARIYDWLDDVLLRR